MAAAGCARPTARVGVPSEAASRRYGPASLFVVMMLFVATVLSSCTGGHSTVAAPREASISTTTVTAARPRRGYWLMGADGQISALGMPLCMARRPVGS